MDINRGILCKLTHEKAIFEDACNDFDLDQIAEQREKEQNAALQKSEPVAGWLAFFLWIGLGFGGIGSLVVTLKNIADFDYSIFFVFLHVGATLILTAIAAYAIYAFYQRKPNAVALAKTYMAMVLVDGVVGFLICLITDQIESSVTLTRQFVWVGIWYCYLQNSSQVEERIPAATRTWEKTEKFALSLYAIAYVTILLMSGVQSSTNVLLRTESYIRQSVDAAKAELPIDVGEDIEMSGFELDDKTIRYEYRLKNVHKIDLNAESLPDIAEQNKQEVLDGWSGMLMTDEFISLCCSEKMTMVFSYIDCAGEFLYEIVIAPEDYRDRMPGIGYTIKE
jgi:hypothetical protein